MTRYLEFAAASNFSFLRGASHPEELMLQATHLGLDGLGLCDRNSAAGVVRAHVLKREKQLSLAYHPGARLVFCDGTPDILAYPRDRPAWGRLCRLLTRGNLRAEKGECILYLADLLDHIEGLELIVMERSTWELAELPVLRQQPDRKHDALSLPAGEMVGVRGFGSTAKTKSPHAPPLRGEVERAAHTMPDPTSSFAGAGASKAKLRLVVRKQENRKDTKTNFLARLREAAPGRVRLAACMLYRGDDRARLLRRAALAQHAGVPLIAVNDVLYHHPDRRELQDVLTCIREHLTIEQAGRRLAANAERYLKKPNEMARLFRDAPQAIEETQNLDAALTFSLDDLAYDYPDETRAAFATPQDALTHFAFEGAAHRYPGGIPDEVRKSLAHELALIAELKYAPYFLTVHDIVRYARSQDILCQGRGSAANSVVCYCLGVTEVDPKRVDLLFERFVSADRREPPDIDVDFEHERREEVIQYIYRRYGRERAGIAGTVISYRGRSAIREVGKVFGLSEDTIGALSSSIWGMGGSVRSAELARAGIDLKSPRMQKMRALAEEIQSFPRHLSQHVGGFVITRSRLDEVVPIGNGAMDERTFVEWDKDDLDALKILKVDVLGLGMLTCIRKGLDLVAKHYGEPSVLSASQEAKKETARTACAPLPAGERSPRNAEYCAAGEGNRVYGGSRTPSPQPSPLRGEGAHRACSNVIANTIESTPASPENLKKLTLATIPAEETAVYRMLCRADSLGVFQVESRAQMSMLPRLRPQNFYDLVIEVAIVRPGPIQGDMVHPYLRRRERLRATGEQPDYPSPSPDHGNVDELRDVLHKTLGVPLFQEQAMKIAIVAAKFTPSEADRLRRAMATFRRVGTIGTFQRKMVDGMVTRGYARDFAERCFSQIEGFGEYGFPESHAASFALLVYASAWLKCRYPDVFAAALLNSQPMGFYAPAQIVRDVREHGVEVRPVDINFSDWDATLEEGPRATERLHALHREMADDIRATHALRLGFRKIKGLSEKHAERIVAQRLPQTRTSSSPALGPIVPAQAGTQTFFAGFPDPRLRGGERSAIAHYTSVRDLWLRTGLPTHVIERLADADAFGSLGLTRRQALWAAKALGRVGDKNDDLPLFRSREDESAGIDENSVIEHSNKSRSDAAMAPLASPPPLRGRDREGGNANLRSTSTPLPDPPPTHHIAEPGQAQVPWRREPTAADGEKIDSNGEDSRKHCSNEHRFVTPHQSPVSVAPEPAVALPPMPLGEEVVNDYRFLELSLRSHPAFFLRADLAARNIIRNEELRTRRSGERVTVSGLVTIRQRPGSAAGVIFMTIEDETAIANIIVWPKKFERFRPIILGARYIAVTGTLQHESDVIHVVADRLADLTPLLARLTENAPPIQSLARADAVKRPHDEDIDSRARGRRNPPRLAAPANLPDDLASDLDVPARGSAHAPTRRGGARSRRPLPG